ncbi:MAG: hypothetical protein ACXWBP_06765 [Limisphaerales bacterium]
MSLSVFALSANRLHAAANYDPYTFTTFAGPAGTSGTNDGTGCVARFNIPHGVATDTTCNVYVADRGNNTIRKITPAGVVTILAGLPQFDSFGDPIGGSADGTGGAARFDGPAGVATDSSGNVYAANSNVNAVRKVTPAGVVTRPSLRDSAARIVVKQFPALL